MHPIGQNLALLTHLNQNYSLLNNQLASMLLYIDESNSLVIEIVFSLAETEKNKHLRLKFTDVVEYMFYYKSDYTHYTVRRLKFLHEEECFYFCIDPEDELPKVSHTDKDIIRARNVEGFLL
jgi:hypothetical protein